MNYYLTHLRTFNILDFFLIFAAAMSSFVCVAVRVRNMFPSHQQASKTEKKAKSLWSEAEFRKIYSDYRHCRVALRLANISLRMFEDNGSTDEKRRERLSGILSSANSRKRDIIAAYNEMSGRAIKAGKFPSDLPRHLSD